MSADMDCIVTMNSVKVRFKVGRRRDAARSCGPIYVTHIEPSVLKQRLVGLFDRESLIGWLVCQASSDWLVCLTG